MFIELIKCINTGGLVNGVFEGIPAHCLDDLPFPNYDLVDISTYDRIVEGNPSVSLISSRGCPYDCVFCNSRVFSRGKLRFRSPENVVQEIVELQNKAAIVNNHISASDRDILEIVNEGFCSNLFENTETRLTIIDSSGVVLCDSEKDASLMENHSQRPELIRALAGETGMSSRYSRTIEADFIYVAIPLIFNDKIVGAIRTSRSISIIHNALMEVYLRVILGGLAVMILILLASLYTSRRISEPLNQMRLISQEYARGVLNRRLPDHESVEIGELADSMNKMASELEGRIGMVIRQRNEQQAVLSSMEEGVLAIDLNERIININSAIK